MVPGGFHIVQNWILRLCELHGPTITWLLSGHRTSPSALAAVLQNNDPREALQDFPQLLLGALAAIALEAAPLGSETSPRRVLEYMKERASDDSAVSGGNVGACCWLPRIA